MSDALTKAGAYLQDSQKVDGGFGSVYSTAWTAQAMHALGEEWKKNGKGVEDYFARVQESDGALLPSSDTNENRIWATSYVIVGKPWNEILRKVAKREVMKPEVRVQEEPNVMAPAIQNTPQIPKIVELTPEISEPAQAVPENILVANAAESGQGIPKAAVTGLIGMVVGFVIKKVWLLF